MTFASFDVSIAPACVVPYQLEAVTSDRWALFEDLDALQQKGCFGDTTTFSMEFRSTAAVQCYQVLVRDRNFDTILTSLAVRVPEPATGLALALGAIGLAGSGRIRRRPRRRGNRASTRRRRAARSEGRERIGRRCRRPTPDRAVARASMKERVRIPPAEEFADER